MAEEFTLDLDVEGLVSGVTESAISTAVSAATSVINDVTSLIGNIIDGFMNDIAEVLNSIVDTLFANLGIASIINSVIGFIEAPFAIFDNLFNYFWDPFAAFVTGGLINGKFFFEAFDDIIQTPTAFAFGDIGMGVNAGTLYERPLTRHPLFPSEQDIHRVCRGDATVYQPGGMKYTYDQQRDSLLDEPQMDYNPTYPYNHYTESESGHIYEIDDTPSHERLQIKHRAGTGFHVNPDGTQKSLVVGDNFAVILQDNKAHVFGNLELFIDKDAKISINGEGNISIGRNANIFVGNDTTIHTQNNTNIFTGKNTNVHSMEDIDVRAGKYLRLTSLQRIEIIADTQISLSAPRIDINTEKLAVRSPLTPVSKALHEMEIPFNPYRFQLRNEGNFQEGSGGDGGGGGGGGDSSSGTTISQNEVQNAMTDGELSSEEWVNRQPDIVLGKEKDDKEPPAQTAKDMSVSSFKVEGDLKNPNNPVYDLKISKHCFLRDVTLSPTFPYSLKAQCGLSVEEIIKNLSNLAAVCIDPLYEKYGGFVVNTYGRPKGKMRITNAFRVEAKCGWHAKGCAFDYQVPDLGSGYYYDEAIWCRDNIKGWDHILLEYKTTGSRLPWIHFGARRDAASGKTQTFMNHTPYDKSKFVNLAHKNKPTV